MHTFYRIRLYISFNNVRLSHIIIIWVFLCCNSYVVRVRAITEDVEFCSKNHNGQNILFSSNLWMTQFHYSTPKKHQTNRLKASPRQPNLKLPRRSNCHSPHLTLPGRFQVEYRRRHPPFQRRFISPLLLLLSTSENSNSDSSNENP